MSAGDGPDRINPQSPDQAGASGDSAAPPNATLRIAPSVLSADFSRLAEEVALVEAAGADLLHVDVMDGHFVPNLAIGVPIVESLRPHTRLLLDTHLMVEEPARFVTPFVEAGSDSLTFHIEVAKQPRELIAQIRQAGVKVGVALNPNTPAEAILDIIHEVDIVLVMTVWPGFGGQKFLRECLPKVEVLAEHLKPGQWLEVDGGINLETGAEAVAAGANTLVAGAAVFRAEDPAGVVRELRRVGHDAASERGGRTDAPS